MSMSLFWGSFLHVLTVPAFIDEHNHHHRHRHHHFLLLLLLFLLSSSRSQSLLAAQKVNSAPRSYKRFLDLSMAYLSDQVTKVG
jgi:hypothetical protein